MIGWSPLNQRTRDLLWATESCHGLQKFQSFKTKKRTGCGRTGSIRDQNVSAVSYKDQCPKPRLPLTASPCISENIADEWFLFWGKHFLGLRCSKGKISYNLELRLPRVSNSKSSKINTRDQSPYLILAEHVHRGGQTSLNITKEYSVSLHPFVFRTNFDLLAEWSGAFYINDTVMRKRCVCVSVFVCTRSNFRRNG